MAAHNNPAPSASQTAFAEELAAQHETPIKTPRELIIVLVLAFVVPIVVIWLLARFAVSHVLPAAGTDATSDAAVRERLRPVAGFELRPADGSGPARSPEEVYKATCSACHTAGVAGAPKTGDAAAWAPRIAEGLPTLFHSALKGKGAMPPQGGGDFSDYEIERTVVMMANKGGAHFQDPPPPGSKPADAAGAAGAAGAAPAAGSAPAPAPAPAASPAPAAAPAAASPAAASPAPAPAPAAVTPATPAAVPAPAAPSPSPAAAPASSAPTPAPAAAAPAPSAPAAADAPAKAAEAAAGAATGTADQSTAPGPSPAAVDAKPAAPTASDAAPATSGATPAPAAVPSAAAAAADKAADSATDKPAGDAAVGNPTSSDTPAEGK